MAPEELRKKIEDRTVTKEEVEEFIDMMQELTKDIDFTDINKDFHDRRKQRCEERNK